jgi:hypothetical protein
MGHGWYKITAMSLMLIISYMGNLRSQCDNISILCTGTFHLDEASEAQAGQWLGLFETATGWELRRIDVKIQRDLDLMMGDNPDDPSTWTGWIVSTGSEIKPLFLVRGLHDANLGSVKTLFVGKTMVMPESSLALGQQGFRLSLGAKGIRSGNRYSLYGLSDYILLLYVGFADGVQSQELISVRYADPGEAAIDVLWVGDLDADGKPDLLIDTGNHYTVMEYSLYLSSCAQNDELVRCVAQFRSSAD